MVEAIILSVLVEFLGAVAPAVLGGLAAGVVAEPAEDATAVDAAAVAAAARAGLRAIVQRDVAGGALV